jgi:hypothetical protein
MKMEKKKYGKYENYEIERIADAMTEVEECKKDEQKMKYVLKCLKDKQSSAKNAVKSIKDIRKAYSEAKEEE